MRTITVASFACHEWDRSGVLPGLLARRAADVYIGNYLSTATLAEASAKVATGAGPGYVEAFLDLMDTVMPLLEPGGPTVVTNAGGLAPRQLAQRLRERIADLGLALVVAEVFADEGDEQPALGGFGIARAIAGGADIIVTGPVAVASLTVGAATAQFHWRRDDFDQLAGAVVAGLVLAGGTQATGGNFSGFTELDFGGELGQPLVTIDEHGGSVVTKHPGTAGAVTVDTVTAQLMHRVTRARIGHPDVVCQLDLVELVDDGDDRVAIVGAVGHPPLADLRLNRWTIPEYRNVAGFVLTGLDVDAKVALVRRQLDQLLAADPPDVTEWQHIATAHVDPDTPQSATSVATCHVRSADPAPVGESFARAVRAMSACSFPGCHLAAPPQPAEPVTRRHSRWVPQAQVSHLVGVGAETESVQGPPATQPRRTFDTDLTDHTSAVTASTMVLPDDPGAHEGTVEVALGRVVHATSAQIGLGDRVTLGAWIPASHPRRLTAFAWLASLLDPAGIATVLPGLDDVGVTVTPLQNLAAVVVSFARPASGPIGEAAGLDPQARALGEWLRARVVPVPRHLVEA